MENKLEEKVKGVLLKPRTGVCKRQTGRTPKPKAQKKAENKNVTPRQERFIKRYLTHGIISKAMREAGYKGNQPSKQGGKLLSAPHIKKRVETLRRRREDQLKYDMSKAVEDLMEIKERTKESKPDTAIKAISEIGRLSGWYVEKTVDLTEKIKEAMPAQEVSKIVDNFLSQFQPRLVSDSPMLPEMAESRGGEGVVSVSDSDIHSGIDIPFVGDADVPESL